MNLTQEELTKLEGCQTRKEWVSICDEIKASRDGRYPKDWYIKVIVSGLLGRIAPRWGGDDKIHIRPLI